LTGISVMTKRTPPRGDQQADLFAANFADIPIRDQRDTMERPFFSLAKKPRLTPIEYSVGDVWVEVSANSKFGMATIWDADILIWASTQITEALDRGQAPSRTIGFHPHNLLKSIRRPTGGEHYQRIRAALERLTHTAVRTNIRAEGKKKAASFHWLESWTEVTDEQTGETNSMTMTLPDWLFDGILMKGGVLTIHEDYFLLTGGIARWLYRVARKHAGHQEGGWQFTMRQLYEKSGSASRFSDFAIDVRKVIEADSLPEYTSVLHKNEEGDEIVHFVKRDQLDISDPRYECPRHPRRRHAGGITSKALRFN
jgi:plasmid replication initiation protein